MLPRLSPLRTVLETFASHGSSRPLPSCYPHSCRSGWSSSARGPFAELKLAANLSLRVLAILPVVVGWSTRPTSAGCRREHIRPIRRVMPSPCLSAGGLRFLGLLGPAAALSLPSEDRQAYRPLRAGPQRGCRVSHSRAATGGGCLLYPGTWVSCHEQKARERAGQNAPAVHRPKLPGAPPEMAGPVDEASTKVHWHSPVLSFPCLWHPGGLGCPWAFTPCFRTFRYLTLAGRGNWPWTLASAAGTEPVATLCSATSRRWI